jgi:hypothetical protein
VPIANWQLLQITIMADFNMITGKNWHPLIVDYINVLESGSTTSHKSNYNFLQANPEVRSVFDKAQWPIITLCLYLLNK